MHHGGVVQSAAAAGPLLGFNGIPISRADTVSLTKYDLGPPTHNASNE
jgi:hypothetical protein